jgi:hypothetical protein
MVSLPESSANVSVSLKDKVSGLAYCLITHNYCFKCLFSRRILPRAIAGVAIPLPRPRLLLCPVKKQLPRFLRFRRGHEIAQRIGHRVKARIGACLHLGQRARNWAGRKQPPVNFSFERVSAVFRKAVARTRQQRLFDGR